MSMENFSTKGQVNLCGKESTHQDLSLERPSVAGQGLLTHWVGVEPVSGHRKRVEGSQDSPAPSTSWTATLSQEQPGWGQGRI